MAKVNSSLQFSTSGQSLWRPGPATDLRIDTGDLLVWDPGEFTKTFDTGTFLGFGASATFYAKAKFGLVAFANLGTGGSFDATYDIDVALDLPGAVLTKASDPTSKITFTYSYDDISVSNATLNTIGFGNSTDPDISVGAGIDLITELGVGFRDITFFTPFKNIVFDEVSILNIEEDINLFTVTVDDAELEIPLTDDVSLFARLPTGANVEASSEDTVVGGTGFSDTKFLELEADLDSLLTSLLNKIPLPPVKAAAKFLEEFVFAEHKFDLSDYLTFLPAKKIEFNFTLLDISASAGLVVTEDVSLDITAPDGVTPYLQVTLTSATTGESTTGLLGLFGQSETVLQLDAPAGGFGTDEITAEYEIVEARLTHTVGIGLSASITITVLEGNLSGAWVPSALKFSFGPLAEIEIPEGGLNVKLGDLYTPDPFTIASDAFNTATDTYEVYFASASPAGWDRDAPGAEQELFAFAQAFLANEESLRTRYEDSGFNVTTSGGDGARNFSGDSNFATPRMFIWNGLTTNRDVTLNQNNGSITTIDFQTSGPNGAPLNSGLGVTGFGGSGSFPFVNGFGNPFNSRLLALNAIAELDGQHFTFIAGEGAGAKTMATNTAVNIVGGSSRDFLPNIGNAATFFDGGAGTDTFIADFSVHDNDTPINFDLAAMNTGPDDRADIQLANRTITLKSIESISMRTGDANDVIRTYSSFDRVETGGGNDVVDLFGDFAQDMVDLGAGDDVLLVSFREVTAGQGALQFADLLFGGSGYDAMYLTSGQQGLKIDIFVNDGIRAFAFGVPLGHDATHADLTELQDTYFNMFASLEERANTLTDPATNRFITLVNGDSDFGELAVYETIEVINIEDGGFVADDLVMFFGGTRYEGGAGTDTFTANFTRFESLNGLGDRGGVIIDPNRDVSFYGATQITGFERFHIVGTTASDVLRGGALDDFLDGGAGNDLLYGGDDSVADILRGGAGDDVMRWANDGLDDMDGGDGTDALLVEADGTETSGLRIAYFDAGENPLDPLEWFFALDSTELALLGLNVARQALETGVLGFDWDGSETYALARRFESVDIVGSDAQSDLIQYLNGTRYEGGEGGGDADLFLADWSDQAVGVQLDLNAAIGAASADGVTLTNGVFLSGIERAILRAGQGNDLLIGGALDDHFEGNGGADIFMGHGGTNRMLGGAGNDLFYYMAQGVDTIEGGDGRDSLIIGVNGTATADGTLIVRDVNGDSLTDDVPAFSAFASGRLLMDDLAEEYLAQGVSFTHAFGGGRSVTHSGIEVLDHAGSDAFNDIVLYMGGEGYVGGTRGDGTDRDTFVGDFTGETADLFFTARDGANPNDVGQGTSLSGFERFVTILGSGDDTVIGGRLEDAVRAGAGNDVMDGGAGNDSFEGGDGDDLYLYTRGADHALMGAGEGDTVVIGGLIGGVDAPVSFAVNASITGEFQFGSSFGLAYFASNEDGLLDVSAFDDLLAELEFNEFRMIFTWPVPASGAGEGINTAGVEHFEIYGSSHNDVLVAGKRASVVVGNDGDDFLVAHNEEVDFLSGGAGQDTYVILGEKGGTKVIAGEFDTGSRLHFADFDRSDVTFFADGNDLFVGAFTATGFAEVIIRDYYANGSAAGLDFVFSTRDDGGFAAPVSGAGTTRLAGRDETGSADPDVFGATTALSDTVFGLEGDDQLPGSAGGDLFFAGLGSDGMDYSASAEAVDVDLERYFAFGGDAEGDILVSVEQVHGSDLGDGLDGNQSANTLIGGGGDDFIRGRAGRDTLLGGLGDDFIRGDEGNDLIQGEEDDDRLFGGAGNDHLIGGSGDDLIFGEDESDVMEGGLGADIIEGGDGDDFHVFVGGFDLFDGGAGTDTTSFAEFDSAVFVSLADGGAVTAYGDSVDESAPGLQQVADYISVENVLGSTFDDVILGDGGTNVLDGGTGDDGIAGGAGTDVLRGGAGSDTLRYDLEAAVATQGVTVDLTGVILFTGGGQQGIDSTGATDILSGFENVTGTSFNDTILGDAQENVIRGGGGNDTLGGEGGNDVLEGGGGDDVIYGNGIDAGAEDDDDILRGEGGFDFLFGEGGDDLLDGGDLNDELYGGAGDDILIGGAGTDLLDGGDGQDIADYRWTTQGVIVEATGLHAFTASGAESGLDTGIRVELVLGGAGNDIFTGSAESDAFGHTGGFDIYDGGSSGLDRVTFAYFDAAVDVDMTRANNQARSNGTEDVSTGGLSAIADFTGIDAIEGSRFGDRLTAGAPAGGLALLFGGGGNDLLTGALGAFNILDGGDGDDIFTGLDNFLGQAASPIERFDGGEGFDLISFDGSSTGVVYSLVDGDGDDVIANMEGLIGSAQGDILFGSDRADLIDSGLGDDDVNAGAGEDTVIYRGGFDIYDGGAGFDTLDLSALGVAVYVQEGVVATDGDGTAPDVNGGAPFTELMQYVRFENFVGTVFDDILFGDARDNRFADGLGDDTVFGLGGNDLFTYAGGSDAWDGGDGQDTVNFINFGAAVSVSIAGAGGSGEAETSDGATVEFASARSIATLAGMEHVVGTRFDDILTGSTGANILSGDAGDDRIDGGLGDDDLFGGAGIDTVAFLGASGAVTVDLRIETRQDTGGSGRDIIAGFENITGSVFADLLIGTDDDNVIDGFFGDDEIRALGGNDTILLTEGDHIVDGGSGTDTVDMSRNELGLAASIHLGFGQADYMQADLTLVGAGRLTSIENAIGTGLRDFLIGSDGANMLEGGGGADFIDGGAGSDAASYAGSAEGVTVNLQTGVHTGGDAEGDTLVSIENVLGSAQRDTLVGDDGNNVLDGGAGNDQVRGGNGNDTLSGGEGNDVLRGGNGQDGLSGGVGDDTLFGGNDADLLLGDDGNDTLAGEAGEDILQGGRGNDSLSGGTENDALSGGEGDDSLSGDDGDDLLAGGLGDDLLDGGLGIDTADYSAATGRVDANLTLLRATGAAGRDTLAGIENLTGSDLSDVLNGDALANVLRGQGGSDVLRGKDGDDRIFGGAGADRIFGDDGSDYIEGGLGDDIIRSGDGNDEVFGGRGNDVIRTGAGGDEASGEEGDDRLFGNRDADILDGGIGNDRLDGGGGADELYGGAGDDALRGGSGQDWLYGGEGDDNLFGGDNRDTFVFAFGDVGIDEIKDFENGLDLIDLSDFGFADFTQAAGFASDIGAANMKFDFTVLGFDAIIRVENFRVADLDPGDLILTS